MTNLGTLSTEFQSWSDFTPHWWCSDLYYCPWQARLAGAQPRPLCKTVLCHLFGFCVGKRLHSAADPFSTWLLNNRFFKVFFSFWAVHCHTFIHNQSSVVSSAKPRVPGWAQTPPCAQPLGGSLGYFLLPRSERVAPFSSACLSVQKSPGKP